MPPRHRIASRQELEWHLNGREPRVAGTAYGWALWSDLPGTSTSLEVHWCTRDSDLIDFTITLPAFLGNAPVDAMARALVDLNARAAIPGFLLVEQIAVVYATHLRLDSDGGLDTTAVDACLDACRQHAVDAMAYTDAVAARQPAVLAVDTIGARERLLEPEAEPSGELLVGRQLVPFFARDPKRGARHRVIDRGVRLPLFADPGVAPSAHADAMVDIVDDPVLGVVRFSTRAMARPTIASVVAFTRDTNFRLLGPLFVWRSGDLMLEASLLKNGDGTISGWALIRTLDEMARTLTLLESALAGLAHAP